MTVPRWIGSFHTLYPKVAPRRAWPLRLGLGVWPLYLFFVWLLSRGNDWGFFDTAESFLTFVPTTVAGVVAAPSPGGAGALVFWIVAVLAIPLLAAMMAYGPLLLVVVGAIVGLSMVGPLALVSLALVVQAIAMVFYAPVPAVTGLLVIAAYLAYVVGVHRLLGGRLTSRSAKGASGYRTCAARGDWTTRKRSMRW